ncbi:MAG TPA: RdgB/HAM1 family non-canonical purine NTP pyrophosphatase [Solirubrobacterales bacterium]|nr:RdgB/HAM1 family non-canonical purine NTP pyrophosphatase [Solirubrobacterales bacterium]
MTGRGATAKQALVLATRNEHKLREMADLLPGAELEPLPDEVELPPETGDSFEANALIKARAGHAATGRTTIADDSGIEAADLGGAPGIYSARYAGEGASDEENLAKLLREVAAADGDRRAAYVCAIALVDEGGHEYLFEARCEGTLLREGRGSGGFGYDPVFVPDETGRDDQRTFSELPLAEKQAVSHRGKAARMLARHLGLEAGAEA